MMDTFRILYIDDDVNMLNSAEDMLINEGYNVSLAKSGKQAIDFLSKGIQCDLILLDVDMPEMDGYETLQEIKKIKGCDTIPVIFLTGMDSPDYEIKGLEMGAEDYITKPFIKDVMLARVKKQLRKVELMREQSIELTYDKAAMERLQKELSETEYTIAMYIAQGLTNQEIAEATHYSYAYVKKVTSTILSKLYLSKRSEIRTLLKGIR